MSDPVTNVEIEDVLSSIRRLVSEGGKDASARREDAEADNRLVLTPALRVNAEAEDVESEVDDLPVARADRTDLEATIAELEAAVTRQPDDWEPDGSETATTPRWSDSAFRHREMHEVAAELTATQDDDDESADEQDPVAVRQEAAAAIEEVIAEEVEPTVAEILSRSLGDVTGQSEADIWGSGAEDTSADAEPVDNAAAEDVPDDAAEQEAEEAVPLRFRALTPRPVAAQDDPVDVVEAGETSEAWAEAIDDDAVADDAHADVDEASGEAIAFDPDGDDPAEADSENDEDDAVSALGVPETDEAAGPDAPEPDARVAFRHLSRADTGDDEVLALTGTSAPAARTDAPLPDEEALRAMVRDLVREELQGKMGERITRNVRKLVRREIMRMMNMQDLD